MFEKLFQSLLRKYFGQFLTGLQNTQLAFWTGKINLHNISLKHAKINQILKSNNIPFSIKYSHIGSLEIDIPWKSLSSTPVQIKISKVYIVLKMEKITSVTKNIGQVKLSLIKNYLQHLIDKTLNTQKNAQQQSQSYMQKMAVKIIHNLNADIKDISIRIVQNHSIRHKKNQTDVINSSVASQSKSINSQNSLVTQQYRSQQSVIYNTEQRLSKHKQKTFAFGFCIKSFNIDTVDEQNVKKFYNLDNKKASIRKIISLQKISVYLEDESVKQIFKISQQQKIQFLQQIILRQQHRLLMINGHLIMTKNLPTSINSNLNYHFSMQLQHIQIKCSNNQLKQLIKIITNFINTTRTKQIKKLTQISQHQQDKLKNDFIKIFHSFYSKNFNQNHLDQNISNILCSLSKKNLLSWTRQCAIDIIKNKKIDLARKQKNKKGWLSYIISQAEVQLTQQQIQQIYKQVQQIVKSIEYNKKISLGLQLIFAKITFLLSHQHLQQYLSFHLNTTNLKYIRLQNQFINAKLSISSASLKYSNKKQAIESDLLRCGSQNLQNFVQIQFTKDNNQRRISLSLSKIQINHQTKVLLLIHQILKLKAQQQMKSDAKLKKIQLSQQKNIQSQFEKNYKIHVNISQISFKIQVTDINYVLISLQSVLIQTDQTTKVHNGKIQNFNICYINHHRKSREKPSQTNHILKDFTILFTISMHFNKINTKIQSLQLIVNQDDLHHIYRNFIKQVRIFKTQKAEQKKKRIHQNAYFQGPLRLLSVMKTWKDYQAILTDEAIYFFQQDTFNQATQTQQQSHQHYSHMIPINNLIVTPITQQQFKLQSRQIYQLIQCSKDQLTIWIQYIQKIVFENSSRNKMYNLIDKDSSNSQIKQQLVPKYYTQIKFELQKIKIMISQNRNKHLIKIQCSSLIVTLNQNGLFFQRTILLDQISVIKLQDIFAQSQFNILLTNKKISNKIPMKLKIQGMKKLHPQYRGQLEVQGTIPYLSVNYDPQFIYRMIRKVAWGEQVRGYKTQIRNTKILQMVKQFLTSTKYNRTQSQLNSKNCTILDKIQQYTEISRYRSLGNTCLVLLGISGVINELQLNLINGTKNLCIFNVKSKNLTMKIDKGSQFLFAKISASQIQLFDVSGYPSTNSRPLKKLQPYKILQQKPSPKQHNQSLQLYFSKFDLNRFINKSRIKNFFLLNLYDLHLKFQNQIFNRFIDYLLHQIINFVLAPHSLHTYDGPSRGPYHFDHHKKCFKEKQIREIIIESLQPFFTKIIINAYNVTTTFNSFPKHEGIQLKMDLLKIQTFSFEKSQKIRFNHQQLTKAQKQPIFKQLLKTKGFQQKLIKNHWASCMNIVVQGIKSPIFQKQVPNITTYVQRTLNLQKQLLFPFIQLDTSLICQSQIKHLSIQSSKSGYNLINKCILHNITYDDNQDINYIHDHQFRHYIKTQQIFYKLKSQQFQIIMPELNAAVTLSDFQFKFIRHANFVKQMSIDSRYINMFRNDDVIITLSDGKDKNQLQNAIQFRIQMRTNGQKHMIARLRNVDILYNLPFFLQFAKFTLIDQSCYPPPPQGTIILNLPDLPIIVFQAQLINSPIKFVVPQLDNQQQFLLGDNINFIWIRNQLINPLKYQQNIQLYPINKISCDYKIQLKDSNIRKKYKFAKQTLEINDFKNKIKDKYRAISNKINIAFKISNVMKLASNKIDKYNDYNFQLIVDSLGIKLCYLDIEQLKAIFGIKTEKPNLNRRSIIYNKRLTKNKTVFQSKYQKSPTQISLSQHQNKPSFISYKKCLIDIGKIQIQLGLSQLPVPLLDLSLKNSRAVVDIHGQNISGKLQIDIMANCWNMLIGRWQPIIQDLSIILNIKIGKDLYLLLDCTQTILFNISLQSLKILKLISNDFKLKGKFSIDQIKTTQSKLQNTKVKGINISPYVLTNRTGLNIQVLNQITNIPIFLKPQQKTYIQLKNYDIDIMQKPIITFKFQDSPERHRVSIDLAVSKKQKIQYKKREYQLLLKPISTSIMKQIVISSLFVIQNKTSYQLIFNYNCGLDQDQINNTYQGKIKIIPRQKIALKFIANTLTTNLKGNKKNLKIDFPQLQKNNIQNNCQFPYQALINDYQHCIQMSKNKTFNCVVSVNKQIQNTIIIQSGIYLKNLLPVDIFVEFSVERNGQRLISMKFNLKVNQDKDIYEFGSKQHIQIRLTVKGFNISSFQDIASPVGNQQATSTLNLVDYRGNQSKISLKTIKKGKVRRLFIYSQAVFINQTHYAFYIFSENRLIPGQRLQSAAQFQTKYTFISASQVQSITFGFNQQNLNTSNSIKISELGDQDVQIYKNPSLYQFVVKINFHCLDKLANIYSYVLNAQPKYILINQTNFTMQVGQQNTQNRYQIKSGQRFNWIWPVKTQPKTVMIRPKQNQIDIDNMEWNFSSPLKITRQDFQQCVITLRSQKKPNTLSKKLLKLTPIRHNISLFILIQQVTRLQDQLITITNQLQHCQLKVYQQCTTIKHLQPNQSKYFLILPKSSIPFGWDQPSQQHRIIIQFVFIDYLKTKYQPYKTIINLDQQKNHKITITNQDDQFQQIQIKIQIIGIRKRITFSKTQAIQQLDQQLQLQHVGNKFAFSLTQIGISVITSVKKRAQLLYINVRKVQVILMQKKTSRSLQVKVKYVNIDNNYNHNTIYPILFTPLKHYKTLNKSRPFFVLLLEQTLQTKDIIEIRQLRICNQPLCIKIHDQILTAVFQMIQQLNQQTDKSSGKINLLSIFKTQLGRHQWQILQLKKPQRDIFFRQFQIGKLQIQVTFSIRPKKNTDNFIIMTILSSFGAAISNVSQAQLTLSRFLKKDKGFSEIKSQLGNFYFKQFMKGIYKILGSINLFGNPYVFIKMLSQGAWQIVNQPTQGFIKGPIQGAIGIAFGGIFFTRNVIAGTCNSFQAISESISRGVSYMTMDQKFIQRRQKIKIQKSNHLITGIKYGMLSFYTGIEVAVTGLVRHPMEGYDRSGFIGGVTGTLKGISGLATKPISGIFGGISKISQGIKNTALLFQDGPNSKRVRQPRIFISDLAYYKNYNMYQSLAISTLQQSSTKYLYQNVNYISTVRLQQQKGYNAYVLTTRYFSQVDLYNKKLTKQIQINDIKQIKWQGNSLHIITKTERQNIVIKCQKNQQILDAFKKNQIIQQS